MDRIKPTSPVVASNNVTRIKASVGLRKANCNPQSRAADGMRIRFIRRPPSDVADAISRFGDYPAERFQGDHARLRTAPNTGVQRIDVGDLLSGEFEVEDVKVLGETGGLDRLRDH